MLFCVTLKFSNKYQEQAIWKRERKRNIIRISKEILELPISWLRKSFCKCILLGLQFQVLAVSLYAFELIFEQVWCICCTYHIGLSRCIAAPLPQLLGDVSIVYDAISKFNVLCKLELIVIITTGDFYVNNMFPFWRLMHLQLLWRSTHLKKQPGEKWTCFLR